MKKKLIILIFVCCALSMTLQSMEIDANSFDQIKIFAPFVDGKPFGSEVIQKHSKNAQLIYPSILYHNQEKKYDVHLHVQFPLVVDTNIPIQFKTVYDTSDMMNIEKQKLDMKHLHNMVMSIFSLQNNNKKDIHYCKRYTAKCSKDNSVRVSFDEMVTADWSVEDKTLKYYSLFSTNKNQKFAIVLQYGTENSIAPGFDFDIYNLNKVASSKKIIIDKNTEIKALFLDNDNTLLVGSTTAGSNAYTISVYNESQLLAKTIKETVNIRINTKNSNAIFTFLTIFNKWCILKKTVEGDNYDTYIQIPYVTFENKEYPDDDIEIVYTIPKVEIELTKNQNTFTSNGGSAVKKDLDSKINPIEPQKKEGSFYMKLGMLCLAAGILFFAYKNKKCLSFFKLSFI